MKLSAFSGQWRYNVRSVYLSSGRFSLGLVFHYTIVLWRVPELAWFTWGGNLLSFSKEIEAGLVLRWWHFLTLKERWTLTMPKQVYVLWEMDPFIFFFEWWTKILAWDRYFCWLCRINVILNGQCWRVGCAKRGFQMDDADELDVRNVI